MIIQQNDVQITDSFIQEPEHEKFCGVISELKFELNEIQSEDIVESGEYLVTYGEDVENPDGFLKGIGTSDNKILDINGTEISNIIKIFNYGYFDAVIQTKYLDSAINPDQEDFYDIVMPGFTFENVLDQGIIYLKGTTAQVAFAIPTNEFRFKISNNSVNQLTLVSINNIMREQLLKSGISEFSFGLNIDTDVFTEDDENDLHWVPIVNSTIKSALKSEDWIYDTDLENVEYKKKCKLLNTTLQNTTLTKGLLIINNDTKKHCFIDKSLLDNDDNELNYSDLETLENNGSTHGVTFVKNNDSNKLYVFLNDSELKIWFNPDYLQENNSSCDMIQETSNYVKIPNSKYNYSIYIQ